LKVAICFSGQPRFVNECYAGIKITFWTKILEMILTSLFTPVTQKIAQRKYYTGEDFFLEKLEINIYFT
jgi:hypothetical protein